MAGAKKPRHRPAKKSASATTKAARKARVVEVAPADHAPKASDYAVGDQVLHPMFGSGTVLAIDANKLSIEFADGVIKQIVDDYVKPRGP